MTHLLLTLRGALIYERKPRRTDSGCREGERVKRWSEWKEWEESVRKMAPTVWQAKCGKVNCQRACLFPDYVNNSAKQKADGRQKEVEAMPYLQKKLVWMYMVYLVYSYVCLVQLIIVAVQQSNNIFISLFLSFWLTLIIAPCDTHCPANELPLIAVDQATSPSPSPATPHDIRLHVVQMRVTLCGTRLPRRRPSSHLSAGLPMMVIACHLPSATCYLPPAATCLSTICRKQSPPPQLQVQLQLQVATAFCRWCQLQMSFSIATAASAVRATVYATVKCPFEFNKYIINWVRELIYIKIF